MTSAEGEGGVILWNKQWGTALRRKDGVPVGDGTGGMDCVVRFVVVPHRSGGVGRAEGGSSKKSIEEEDRWEGMEGGKKQQRQAGGGGGTASNCCCIQFVSAGSHIGFGLVMTMTDLLSDLLTD